MAKRKSQTGKEAQPKQKAVKSSPEVLPEDTGAVKLFNEWLPFVSNHFLKAMLPMLNIFQANIFPMKTVLYEVEQLGGAQEH